MAISKWKHRNEQKYRSACNDHIYRSKWKYRKYFPRKKQIYTCLEPTFFLNYSVKKQTNLTEIIILNSVIYNTFSLIRSYRGIWTQSPWLRPSAGSSIKVLFRRSTLSYVLYHTVCSPNKGTEIREFFPYSGRNWEPPDEHNLKCVHQWFRVCLSDRILQNYSVPLFGLHTVCSPQW